MQQLTILHLFPGGFISALCRTLAYSLWQGLLLAVIVAIVLIVTKRSQPALRYNLLTGLLLIFIVAVVGTFCFQLNKLTGSTYPLSTIVNDHSDRTVLPTTFIHAQDTVGISALIITFIDRYANIIALAWLLIFLFKAIRLSAGLYNIHRIKRVQTTDAGDHWNQRLQLLANKISISKPVRLLQSGVAAVPVVLGYFKPVILFPAALLASLPATEIEAVLLHELAHIKRRDYLVNLLQQLIEVFFFFNPAVLWISSLIRTERENCCDDIALDQTNNNKVNYIKALVAFQEYRLSLPQYAPALVGRKTHLLHRVKRIIYNNNKTLNAMEKIFLTAGIAVAGFLALAFSPEKNKNRIQSTAITSPIKSLSVKRNSGSATLKDTIPITLNKITAGFNNINTMVDSKRYDLQLNNDVVTALTIDGRKIDDNKIGDYKTTTDAIIMQAKQNIMKEKLLAQKALLAADHDKTDAENYKVLAEKMEKASELSKVSGESSLVLLKNLKDIDDAQSKIKDEQGLLLLEQLKGSLITKQKKELETEALLGSLEAKQSLLDASLSKGLNDKLQSLTLSDEKNNLRLAQLQSELSLKDASLSLADAEVSRKLNGELRASQELTMKRDKQLQLNTQTTSTQIINDLVREKLVKDKKNLSFSLNKDELIVNGVKQPDAIFQKFKEKYVKTEDWNFNYNNKE